MASKTQTKNKIRQDIIEAASMYEQYLAGQAFLYVYGNEYFEVMFPVNRFLHLAGVETRLFAKKFYKNAREKTLTTQQFYFSPRHPFEVSKKKLSCLKRLYELTNTKVRILRNMETASVVYKVGISNLEFTLCLTENRDSNGEKINEYFLPMSLRAGRNSTKNGDDYGEVDFIFQKDASLGKYTTLLVKNENKEVPECVHHLLQGNLLQ